MTRPSWDRYFMDMAIMVATRATCPRAQVGCVLAVDHRAITTGYNGSVAGAPHCNEVGCLMVADHCVRTLHAEQNAIIQAAKIGVSVAGSTAYCTHLPCLLCAKMLINAGVIKVIYNVYYEDKHSLNFFEQAHVKVERVI